MMMHGPANVKLHNGHLSAYEDGTECSETSAYKIQTPGNYPEENIQQSIVCGIQVQDVFK